MWCLSDIRGGVVWGALVLILCGQCVTVEAEEPAARVATVNGHAVLQREVDLELLMSGHRTPTPEQKTAALEQVIDRTLVARYLEAQGSDALAEDIEDLVQFVRTGIESGGDTVDVVLGKLKLTEDDVRQAARVSVRWQAYVRRTVTEKEIREHFEAHREQFDGTQVRISQIVRIVSTPPASAEWSEAEQLLAELKTQLQSGKIEFASAAATQSESPSAKSGGDVGFIRFGGDVPAPVAAAAFSLKTGQISLPIRSTVGVHLVQVTDRRAGELSLEDARPAVLKSLGDRLWQKTVKTLRDKAKITLK
jgi:parvulin-like peptidyl-prolyl isomerase